MLTTADIFSTGESRTTGNSPGILDESKLEKKMTAGKKKIIRMRFIPQCLQLIVVFLKMIEFSDGLPI